MQHLYAIPVALALLVTGILLDIQPQPGHDALFALALAGTAAPLAILFAPLRDSATLAALDAAVITLAVVVVLVAVPAVAIPAVPLLRLGVTCFLVTLAAIAVLAIVPGASGQVRAMLITAMLALIAAPVWLGPVAELTGNTSTLTNLIVAVSPLSAFATALELDVLRTTWFYQHSALGSLRYEYLSWPMYLLILLAANLVLIFTTGDRFHLPLKTRVRTK